jgi:hypothetical protein
MIHTQGSAMLQLPSKSVVFFKVASVLNQVYEQIIQDYYQCTLIKFEENNELVERNGLA